MRQIPSVFKIEWDEYYSVIILTEHFDDNYGQNWMNVHRIVEQELLIRYPGTSHNHPLPNCWEIA